MCLYCENKEENEHFCCVKCDVGMCEDCYNSDVEHTEHLFDYHESVEDEDFYLFIKERVKIPYGYLCYDCLGKLREEFENENSNDLETFFEDAEEFCIGWKN